jgi:hypothetical protein
MAINGQFVLAEIEEVKAGQVLLLNGLNKDHFVLKTVKWTGYVYSELYDDEFFTLHFTDGTQISSMQIHDVRIFEED